MIDAFALQIHGCWIGARIIKTDNFQGASIARTFFIDNYYAIIRLLARTHARQTNH